MPSNSINHPRLSARSKRCILAALTVGALVVILLAAEGTVRVRQYLKYGSGTSDQLYTVEPKTGLRVPIPNLSGRMRTNSSGFRGPEIVQPKPKGTVRIAFLGASTTWCAEVSSNDHVWPHLVIAAVQQEFPRAQFDYINAGVPGYTMDAMLKSMELRVARLNPDAVVIYEATNDLSGELRQLAVEQGLIANATMRDFSWPGEYSLLWNLVEKNLRVLSAQSAARKNGQRLKVVPSTLGEAYRSKLTDVVRAAQRHAKLVAIATFSAQPRPTQPVDVQMRASASAFLYMPSVTPELLILAYARYNEIARQVAADTGALLIDGEYDIPGDSRHFVDTVHFTDAGSDAMAKRVTRALSASTEFRRLTEVVDTQP